jgi:tRNA A37 threonylcarbamoyltransferase TsaD
MAIYVNKNLAQKYLSDTTEDKAFRLQNGGALYNIYQLKDTLSDMDQKTYEHYVTRINSDFANWVGGVFENKRLQEGLDKARTAKEAKLYTERNIKMLERNAGRL